MDTKIRTIKGLIEALATCEQDHCVNDVMQSLDIPTSTLERYYSWNDEHYTRNLLAQTDVFELLLVCWEAGQASYIHSFDSHKMWIHPICGKLKEERFILSESGHGLVQVSSLHLTSSDFSFMQNMGIHRYTNVYEARSVSLVVFAPPVCEFKVYNERTGEAHIRRVGYDKIHRIDEDYYSNEYLMI